MMNLSYIEENISDDQEFITQLLVLFRDSNGTEIDALIAAHGAADYPEIKSVAHKLKSSFRYLGMDDAVAILIGIEQLALSNGDLSEIDEKIQQVKANFHDCVKEINHWLDQQE